MERVDTVGRCVVSRAFHQSKNQLQHLNTAKVNDDRVVVTCVCVSLFFFFLFFFFFIGDERDFGGRERVKKRPVFITSFERSSWEVSTDVMFLIFFKKLTEKKIIENFSNLTRCYYGEFSGYPDEYFQDVERNKVRSSLILRQLFLFWQFPALS